MIKSMTGFGRGEAVEGSVRFEVELRGVNHRFLEIRVRMPQEVADLEAELRNQVGRVARRGRIEITVVRSHWVEPEAMVTINRGVVSRYLEAASTLASDFNISGSLAIDSVLALPGAVRVEYRRWDRAEAEKAVLLEALDRALAGYEEVRLAEGSRLGHDLEMRLNSVEADLALIEREASGATAETAHRLRKRMAALLEGMPLDEVRLAQEAAFLADRSDVTEELVRLRAHLVQARGHLASTNGPMGKPLEFLVQEIHREINTIGSKAESLSISQAVLRVKAEVEKVREQVQNIE